MLQLDKNRSCTLVHARRYTIMAPPKPVYTMVIDAGPILRNDPSISTLLAKCEELVTVPSVLSEIKDQNARSRLEMTWLPFLSLKTPAPGSVKVITDFAKKTGDLAVLSKPDVQILALAYEIECERNGGDWRLRTTPGQKGTNGPPPKIQFGAIAESQVLGESSSFQDQTPSTNSKISARKGNKCVKVSGVVVSDNGCLSGQQPIDASIMGTTMDINKLNITSHGPQDNRSFEIGTLETGSTGIDRLKSDTVEIGHLEASDQAENLVEKSDSDASGSEGWITPSNVKKHQARDTNSSTVSMPENATMQVATITNDFAMQNVLLQMNLNLVSPTLQRIRYIKTHILRCHACFSLERDLFKQFCSRCGKPTLTRVSCSTSQNGIFSIHLKKNMQWTHRGDRFSIPKPVPGSANGKTGTGKGGGKGGWGQELILAEDQREYLRAMNEQGKRKDPDLMSENALPGILTGERGRVGGRPKIGGGRNVNSKKR